MDAGRLVDLGLVQQLGRTRSRRAAGDVAADHFHRFRADVKLMAQMSLKYHRFSIAWARIMPGGTGAVNDEGVAFYSALIDELLKNGIHPVATLYHWDLPLPLQLEHDGWLSHHTANAFVAYARVCFERFGDRVKHWITINEPYTHVVHGFALGDHAPGRMMRPTTEPYIAGHYLLLAHAHAVAVYRQQHVVDQTASSRSPSIAASSGSLLRRRRGGGAALDGVQPRLVPDPI